eukprot:m51a1_g187 putative v-type proton atpase subunit e-like (70) ;mRNA; r:604901-605515
MDLTLLIGSIVMIVIGIVGSLIVCAIPRSDKWLHFVLVWTAIFCMWMMWACVYISQLHPYGVPELKKDK